MSAVNSMTARSRIRRRNIVSLPDLLLYMVYAAAGLGAAGSLYTTILATIDDPIPAAILTLTAAMLFLVAISRLARRP